MQRSGDLVHRGGQGAQLGGRPDGTTDHLDFRPAGRSRPAIWLSGRLPALAAVLSAAELMMIAAVIPRARLIAASAAPERAWYRARSRSASRTATGARPASRGQGPDASGLMNKIPRAIASAPAMISGRRVWLARARQADARHDQQRGQQGWAVRGPGPRRPGRQGELMTGSTGGGPRWPPRRAGRRQRRQQHGQRDQVPGDREPVDPVTRRTPPGAGRPRTTRPGR